MTSPESVWTIGHSTRSIDEFIAVLKHHHIEAIADVRRFPGSRRLPQFGSEALQASLANEGMGYVLIAELGGRRRPAPDTVNTAWRNPSFRGYADHVASDEFSVGLECLCALASRRKTAMMCAEVLWWRCHRSLIADVLMVGGIQVMHIQDENKITAHPYTRPARLYKGGLTYDSSKGEPLNEKERIAAVQPQLGF